MPRRKSQNILKRQCLNVTSDVLYKNLVEHLQEGVWLINKDQKTVYANPKFCQMMEYSLEELLGIDHSELWADESSALVMEINQGKRKADSDHEFEGFLLSKTGKKIPVLLTVSQLPDGGTMDIINDLSKIKEKEENEKILNGAIQCSNDAIIVFDSNAEIKSWNKGAKNIFGYKAEEIIGQKLDKLFSTEEVSKFFKQNSGFYQFELNSKHKNSRDLNIAVTINSIQNGNHMFYLLTARDFTNLVQFEEDLSGKYFKLQEAYSAFGLISRQMEMVFETIELLGSAFDKKSIGDYIVCSLIMITKVDACALRIYNREKDTIDLISSFGVQDWKSKVNVKYHNSLAERACQQKRPIKVVDISAEPLYKSTYLSLRNNLTSMLIVPLRFHDTFIGSLALYCAPGRKLTLFENEFIEKYTKIVETAIYTLYFKQHEEQQA